MKIWKKASESESKKAASCGIAKNLTALKSTYEEDVDEILALLPIWKKKQLNNSEARGEITGKLHSLYGKLTAKKDSVSQGFPIRIDLDKYSFSGTLHCEAGLVSILHKGTRDSIVADEYQDLLKETQVGYHFSDMSMP